MRRAAILVPLLALVAIVVAGCSSGGSATPVEPTVKAPPQTARLGWEERYPVGKPALVFGVSSFTVTRGGWIADITVTNRSDIAWDVGGPRAAGQLAFGVLLFPNDDLKELEQRNRSGDLPAIRQATTYRPKLPTVLRPGMTWRGTMSAPGALAGGLWARLSFGPFISVGNPPPGASAEVVWFTDHAHRLAVISGEPA
jgi:hypothetical protein